MERRRVLENQERHAVRKNLFLVPCCHLLIRGIKSLYGRHSAPEAKPSPLYRAFLLSELSTYSLVKGLTRANKGSKMYV